MADQTQQTKAAEDGAGFIGKYAPVGAELVAHYEAGDDAHTEYDGEGFYPVMKEIVVNGFTRQEPQGFQYCKKARQTNGKCWKDNMECNCERELNAGQ